MSSTTKKTPQQIYKALLQPECTATLVEKSRKKLLNGQLPTKALQKKAEACSEKTPKASPAPRQRRRAESPGSYEKYKKSPSKANIIQRAERGDGIYKIGKNI